MKIYRTTWLIVVAFCISLSVPSHLLAQSGTATKGVVVQNANLRSGPGTTYTIVGSAEPNQVVTITDQTEAGDWYQLNTGQWIAAFLVQTTNVVLVATPTPASIPAPTSTSATANRTANLRGGPGTNHSIMGSVQAGQGLNIVGKNQAGDWFQLADKKWIAAFLVNNAPRNLAVVSMPVPTAPVSLHQLSAGDWVDVVGYATQAQLIATMYESALTQVADLFQRAGETPALMFTDAWQTKVGTQLATIQVAGDSIRELSAPPILQPVHQLLLSAATHFDTSVDLIVEGLTTLDVDKLARAVEEMDAGSEAMAEANEAIQQISDSIE